MEEAVPHFLIVSPEANQHGKSEEDFWIDGNFI